MRTIVIGGGLVGSQVLRRLVERGETPVLFDTAPQLEALAAIVDPARITVVRGDVLDPLGLVAAIRSHDVTRVVHTAANPLLGIGAQEETARTLGLGRVVLTSTSSLTYHLTGGEDGGDARREEAFPRPLTIYAASKQAGESFGLNYARWFGVDVVILRLAAVFGPWVGRGGGGPSHALREMVECAIRGQEATLPATTLECVYSKDVARNLRLRLRRARGTLSAVVTLHLPVASEPPRAQIGPALGAAIGAPAPEEVATCPCLPTGRRRSSRVTGFTAPTPAHPRYRSRS